MSPLKIDLIDPVKDAVILTLGELQPGDLPGSISDHRPGVRDVYVFGCEEDNRSSVVLKSRRGVDIEDRSLRSIISEGFEEVARLTEGQSHDLPITPLNSREEMTVRFTHKERI
jgi:hypothetical protein